MNFIPFLGSIQRVGYSGERANFIEGFVQHVQNCIAACLRRELFKTSSKTNC